MSNPLVIADTLRALGVQLVGAGLGVQILTAAGRKANTKTPPMAVGLITLGAIGIALGIHLTNQGATP